MFLMSLCHQINPQNTQNRRKSHLLNTLKSTTLMLKQEMSSLLALCTVLKNKEQPHVRMV